MSVADYASAAQYALPMHETIRIPARAWLFVIWHCWQEGTAYDPARHQALQRILAANTQAA